MFKHPTLLLSALLIVSIGCESTPAVQRDSTLLKDGDFAYITDADPLTPEQEKAAFHLPPGFEVVLFASEPDIGKPMNMAFDAKGRLWVTQSNEYPFPAVEGEGKDRLTILEDTDGDGRADTFTDFADNLNIPIGVTPVQGGAIVYSIPNVYFLSDHDGDDRADNQIELLTGFGHIDTHGMVNNFLRGLDGWVHAGHGFRNTSHVVGTDGQQITMTSGNTFRFRTDGSGVQTTTTGRVNPFGFAYDDLGYLYGVDCHTFPLYQLIWGGDYPHFGKQPVGIGFPPTMMDHNHGPTAIAGMAYYTATQYPAEFQHNFFSGNPVSNRVNRNSMVMHGATPEAIQQDDFLVSDDGWFRPVDMKLGPDGALYIADFYNRIIGHYEVPLDHPGRDRERGRIWRIVYTGDDPTAEPAPAPKDWTEASQDELLAALGHANLQVRMVAADQLTDRIGHTIVPTLTTLAQDASATPLQRAHSLWVLHRFQAITPALMTTALSDSDALVQTHALRVLFEQDTLDPALRSRVLDLVNHTDPHIARIAIEVLGKSPAWSGVAPLLALQQNAPEEDTHLHYVIRQSLRDHMREPALLSQALSASWSAPHAAALADVMLGVNEEGAGRFLLDHVQNHPVSRDLIASFITHTARYLPAARTDQLVLFVQQQFAEDLDFQYTLFQSVRNGIAQRGDALTGEARAWGIALATAYLEDLPPAHATWKHTPLAGLDNPWITQEMDAAEDFPAMQMIGSDDRGSGVLTSPEFTLPATLSFAFYGLDGPPADTEAPDRIFARLRLADTGEMLAEATIGADMRQHITWRFADHSGQRAVIELVDGAADNSFAFVAMGGFEPAVLEIPVLGPAQVAERQRFAAELAGTLQVSDLAPVLENLFEAHWADASARGSAARALVDLDADTYATRLTDRMADPGESDAFKQQLAAPLGQLGTTAAREALTGIIPTVPYAVQVDIALALAMTDTGKQALLETVATGQVSARLLLDRAVSERLLDTASNDLRATYNTLTADLEPIDQTRQRLIEQRLAAYQPEKAKVEDGWLVYQANCIACHQVDGEGGLIGPQLDGISGWGIERLAEKVLAPNRMVNEGFRTYNVTLTNGEIRTGLFRREEGEVLVLANALGEEITIPKQDIAEQKASVNTLMPDHFGEVLSQEAFDALLTFLASLQ